jgi:hypothetical protein
MPPCEKIVLNLFISSLFSSMQITLEMKHTCYVMLTLRYMRRICFQSEETYSSQFRDFEVTSHLNISSI